ncbi:uncharacterized protein LOC130669968 [Microplitis mediator]|uniref:uncharacterized protein LOC130669968 n=1 Tax=Microplitis mediator TaxID=375433 RepID=UPI0025571953|nr:uncharacterized protein LOC130669968 [Microplitis mediator]
MLTMNIMMYWNAVSMLFSGINKTLVHLPNINIKIKSINVAKASGIIFPNDLNTLFSIYRSLKHYFVDNSMSIRSNVDVEIAMTASKICLRGVDNNCDLQGYTLLLTDDNRNRKYNIAIMNYNMPLLDYAIGARELAHSLGVKYIEADKECSGIMSRRYRFSDEQLKWCNDSLNDFASTKKFVSSIRGNNVSNKNSRNPLIASDDEGEELVVPLDLSHKF